MKEKKTQKTKQQQTKPNKYFLENLTKDGLTFDICGQLTMRKQKIKWYGLPYWHIKGDKSTYINRCKKNKT